MGTALVSRLPASFAFAKRAMTEKKAALKASGEHLPKPKKPNENFWAMLGRMLRAGAKRVEHPHDLADLLKMEAQLKEAINEAGLRLRREGYSLSQIASALDCSSMNVSKRWRLPSEGGEQ